MAAHNQSASVADNKALARLKAVIDHTKLTFADGEGETQAITALCQEARESGFYAVCVRPRHVRLAQTLLAGSSVQVATVIGFPLQKVALADEMRQPTVGNVPLGEKLAETRQAVLDGADELDLVINVARFKQDGEAFLAAELQAVQEASSGRPIKVIIETDLLTPAEVAQATRCCAQAGMAMVKTSTGMVSGGVGATVETVRLIADTLRELNSQTGIKASGGIKTVAQALALLDAGAIRLGTSSGVAILQGLTVDEAAY